jgi:hypothetical protein
MPILGSMNLVINQEKVVIKRFIYATMVHRQ